MSSGGPSGNVDAGDVVEAAGAGGPHAQHGGRGAGGGAPSNLDIGVLILAGGEATRLPGKLTLQAGDEPMLLRVYRNLSAGRPTWVSCKATFDPAIDGALDCPLVVDRWPLRGPLSGLLSTMGEMTTRYVFACAGDSPFVDAAFVDRLAAALREGDEAVVPAHDAAPGRSAEHRRIEPLAAIYDRLAFLREGIPLLLSGEGALRRVIERLATRYVPVADPQVLANVNTPADYAQIFGARA